MSVKISHYGVSSVATRKYAYTMCVLSSVFQNPSDHKRHHSAAIIFITLINQMMAHSFLLLILKTGEIRGYGHPDFEHKIGIIPCSLPIQSSLWDYGTVLGANPILCSLEQDPQSYSTTLSF
jgi:hypothetical protein